MTEAGHHYTLLKGASFLDPQVIADTALYLNSDLAARITGVTIPVDAGHRSSPAVTRHRRGNAARCHATEARAD
jgi:NAD(P)-dependent dehydrogenase (short-subunit alcohol dehydrogenase family)